MSSLFVITPDQVWGTALVCKVMDDQLDRDNLKAPSARKVAGRYAVHPSNPEAVNLAQATTTLLGGAVRTAAGSNTMDLFPRDRAAVESWMQRLRSAGTFALEEEGAAKFSTARNTVGAEAVTDAFEKMFSPATLKNYLWRARKPWEVRRQMAALDWDTVLKAVFVFSAKFGRRAGDDGGPFYFEVAVNRFELKTPLNCAESAMAELMSKLVGAEEGGERRKYVDAGGYFLQSGLIGESNE